MAGSNITSGVAAELISEYVQLSYPNDEEKIFKLLTQIQNQIWETGKFYNSIKYYYCKVFPDGTLITPHGHNVLLGIDLNGKAVDIRDQYFLFHRNGPGDVISEMKKGKWVTDIVDLGESPVLFQPTKQDGCYCAYDDRTPKMLSVLAPNCCYLNTDVHTMVSGLGGNGKNIYTYEKENEETKETETCQCDASKKDEGIEILDGVKYPISSNPVIYKNITFSYIRNIIKEPTLVPVEYYIVDKHGQGLLVARLEPYQIVSKYRRYKLPQTCCKNKCVLGLFKVSQPDRIISKNQIMLTRNEAALISFAIALDYKWNKKDMQSAINYQADGIAHLNAELRENQSAAVTNIQVESFANYNNIVPNM